MRLSNTATPYYYGRFKKAVLDGSVPVNKEVSMQMNLIDDLIADPRFYYCRDVVEGFIKFCEQELVLVDGSPMRLLPTYKLWAEDLLGWYYYEEQKIPDFRGRYSVHRVLHRLRTKQYLIVGRGASKTLYDTCIQMYVLLCDPETTYGVTTAPTMAQAQEVINPIVTAIQRQRGPVIKFLTEGSINNTTGSQAKRPKLMSTKKGIQNFTTNSLIEIRPMAIQKLQGLRCKVATVDEWLSCDIREDPITAIAQGAAKTGDYLILATSSEGTIRNGPGDSIKMRLTKVLRGEYTDYRTSIWWYKLDDVKEVNDPSKWIKANPNLGKTVTYQTYQQEVTDAENDPSQRNDVIAKRFGIPLEGFTYFFTYEETLPFSHKSFHGMECALGADLSRGDDFCAFTFLFPLPDQTFGIKTRSYISELTYHRLPPALYAKYQEFLDEGTLEVLDGTVLDMMTVYDDLFNFIEKNKYDVRSFGYDPYNAKEFVDRWCAENGSFAVEKVIQGAKTESVPLGELKSLAHERMLIFDEKLMQFTMGNSIAIEDTNGNRKLMKKRHEQKIDNVSAMMDAYVAYKANRDSFD